MIRHSFDQGHAGGEAVPVPSHTWAGSWACCALPLSQAQGLGELRFRFSLQQMCSEEPARLLTDRALDALLV